MNKEEKRAKKIGQKVVEEKWCQLCGGTLRYLGATIGGTKLYGCSLCHVAYWI